MYVYIYLYAAIICYIFFAGITNMNWMLIA